MKKELKYGAALLSALLLAACSESEVFYTAVYPVVRVEAAVTVPSTEPEPEPEPEPTPESRADEGETTDPVVEEIKAEIVASAQVQAGGGYTLNFSKYNGGRARIDTGTEAGTVIGAFFKTPGTSEILIYCPEPETEYTFTLSTYQDTDGRTKTVLVTDLTEQYQALYPDAGITKAERRSYTSANAN